MSLAEMNHDATMSDPTDPSASDLLTTTDPDDLQDLPQVDDPQPSGSGVS